MKEELFKDLKKRLGMAKFIAAAKFISDELEQGEGNVLDAYDIRLVTISIKDIDDTDDEAQPFMQIRFRKQVEEETPNFVIVLHSTGYTTPADDEDLKLNQLAESIETITERMAEEYPDKVIIYDWLGD